jgi:hypothetical protein
MQFEITDDAAIIFAHELYAAIADGNPLEAALAEARGAIRDEGNLTEWGTPVLYSRAPDGRLFDLPGQDQIREARRRALEEGAATARQDAEARARQDAEAKARQEAEQLRPDPAGLVAKTDETLQASPWDRDREISWRSGPVWRGPRRRKIEFYLGYELHVVEYKLGNIREWLTVDDTIWEINETPLGKTREFRIQGVSQGWKARLEIKLIADHMIIKRVRLSVMGTKIYEG